MATAVYIGLDMGASRTKVAVIDRHGALLGHAIKKSGIDFAATAAYCLDAALEQAGVNRTHIVDAVATGYGRNNVDFVTGKSKTEIGCHAKGCHHLFAGAITIIDIGGQDNKIIKLNAAGRRESFKMNRKCAAGTGAFLEEMSSRLDIPLEEMNNLARQATEVIKLGSYCTVFSATEVLENIRHGKPVADIIKGIFYSMILRVLEMDSLSEKVVLSGGVVAHNPYLVEMAAELIGSPILLPEFPQLTGAHGAALYALGEAAGCDARD
ncbi:MAG: acyl-CoA dehydratase activase [Desulfuromonadales bacterium]|jgi:predicted CoA-substrate-specific enzyme activase|nr:acyl-CoA dehydratase activase [Desulfuromonadales bacterium]